MKRKTSRQSLFTNTSIIENDGVTLIELMIVLVLSMLLMAAVYMSYQTQSSTSKTQNQISNIQSDLRAAMDIMSSDIINAGCDRCVTDLNNVWGIGNDSSQTLINMHMNYADCAPPSSYSPYSVQYQLSGGGIWRSDSDGGNIEIAQNITSFNLTYLDKDGNDITASPMGTAAKDVSYVQINIVLEGAYKDPSTGQPVIRRLNRTLALRNAGI